MLHAPESQQVLDHFSGEIEDLRTIARLHGLPTGTPDRIAVLPLRLSQDSRLRSDLTELVRSLQMRDSELGLPEILSLILVAVGGSAALTPHRDLAEAVDLTGSFLASLGGWPGSAVEPLIDIDNPPDHDPRLDLAAAAYTETLEGKFAPEIVPEETSFTTPPPDDVEEQPAAQTDGAVSLAEITHALARLERGNLELRLHLDSIDQRICRMEPLLEAVPHSVEPEGPLPPEPPQPKRSATHFEAAPDRHNLPGNLVHRGSSSPDPASALPARALDPQDEIKEKRRISLTSSFLDPANTPAPQAPVRSAPSIAPASIPGSVGDPVSHPRMSTPRRDRFAAARELPSNPADADPLYAPTAEELAAAAPNSFLPSEPHPLPTLYADLGTSSQAPPPDWPSTPSPEPALAFTRSEPQVEQSRPSAPAPVRPEAQAPPSDLPIASPLFGNARGSLASTAIDHEEPPTRRHLPWVAGLAAAAVVGAAGFLYLNGLPSVLNEWVTGSHASVATSDSPSNTGEVSPDREAADTSRPSGNTRPAPANAGRVLGARESFTPSESVERTTPPTFVPGGVMDGYLISAPRPNYPGLASLVGLQGKITFEAMISKTGEVEALKVLGGPQGLRDAATEAVKQWQYRPFQVKGHPVEVRSIIRVDVGSHAGTPADQDPLR